MKHGAEMATKKQKNITNKQEDTDDESGAGGNSGQIEFADFLSSGASKRDDMLSPDEKKRLLSQHKGTHEGRVKNQKEVREQRKLLKEGKVSKQSYQQGMVAESSQYQAHPILSDKAQFSGIDRQTNPLPTENVAETNKENRNKLENQYRLRHAPQHAPGFNPKLLPR